MATSYYQLFLWMASLVSLSHSELSDTIQVQVFPTEYSYSLGDHSVLNDSLIYHDEACQIVPSQSIECSRMMGIPKLIDCDLGPDNGLPRDNTTESFYSLNLHSLTDQHTFFFIFSNSVNLTALTLHYYCTVDIQLQVCVDVLVTFPPMCLPCANSHKYRETLKVSYDPILTSNNELHMSITSDYSSQLHISEIQFFTEVPVNAVTDQELRMPCSVSTSDVPPTCDHWWVDYRTYDDGWVDYRSNDDSREYVTLGVSNRPPECNSNHTSSVDVETDNTQSCEIIVTFQDNCSELLPPVSLGVYGSSILPTATLRTSLSTYDSTTMPTATVYTLLSTYESAVLPTTALYTSSSIYNSAPLPTTTTLYTGSSTPTSPPSDSNVAVIAGAIIGVVAGLTLCAIILLIIVLFCKGKGSINRKFLRERNDLIIPLNMHSQSHQIEEENTATDTQPFDGVSNPVYLPNAQGHAESQISGTAQNSFTGQEQLLLYDEVKNRDHSGIKDHTHLHANGREGDSVHSQLNSEPTYCLATPSVIQIDPTYSRLNLPDSRSAAKEPDPTYSHLDHKTTATVQDPTYSHLDHKTATVKQDPAYSHIHHRLTAEEQTSALDDEYARLDCKTATQKPAPASADYSHIKLEHEDLTEKQNPTTSS